MGGDSLPVAAAAATRARRRPDRKIEGELRMVEPFPEYAWPEVWVWMESFRHRIVDDFGPQTLEAWVEFGLAMGARSRTWAVYRGEELGGLITFDRHSPVMGTSFAMFKRSFWGRATTDAALRAVYGGLFAEGAAPPRLQKIASVVFEDNHAMRDLSRRGGGKEEGLLREHAMRGGKPVNMVLIGMTRGDFENGATKSGDLRNQRGGRDTIRDSGRVNRGADVDRQHHDHAVVLADAEPGAERAGQRHLDGAE